MATPTEQIKTEARRLGFTLVGVSEAVRLETEGVRLEEWLNRGYHASMKWMKERSSERQDPSLIMPSVRSVVSVAVNYYVSDQHSSDPETGRFSRYAWGDDYHAVLQPRMKQLEEYIRTIVPGAESKAYVDTGPVMDKAWAARAGIGWIGKHTNVITREVGSWVFLGTILTSASLDPDYPIEDMCGTCTACIDACPTDAIVEPYILDASRCISYLTIEHRGDLPDETSSCLDRWVFGCDICQDVCPWNRFAKATTEIAFQPRPHAVEPRLEQLASISDEDFSAQFRGSAVKRTKGSGLRRNAVAVLESLRNSEHLMSKKPAPNTSENVNE